MLTIDHPTEFVGFCEKTGRLRCGLLTALLDLEDAPFRGERESRLITITGSKGIRVAFTASEALAAALDKGAQFWIGNLEGTEDAWLVDLH